MPGTKNMKMGSGWVVFGLLITGITYAIAPEGYYVVAYGAVVVGGIQLIIGLIQYLNYIIKGPEGKARAHANATLTATLQAMIATSIADGKVSKKEIATIADVYRQIFGGTLVAKWIKDTAHSMLSREFDIYDALNEKYEMIENSLIPSIFRAAYFVAAADGTIDKNEENILITIANALKMTEHEVVGIFDELQQQST